MGYSMNYLLPLLTETTKIVIMIKGATIIMLFYFLGSILSWIIGGILPGSVCGMLLLFMSLLAKIVKAEDVKGTVKLITSNMALFFIPVSVGIIAALDLVSTNILIFLIVPITTTVMVIITVGIIQQYLEKLRDKNQN